MRAASETLIVATGCERGSVLVGESPEARLRKDRFWNCGNLRRETATPDVPGRRHRTTAFSDARWFDKHEFGELQAAGPWEGGGGAKSSPPAKNNGTPVEGCDRSSEACGSEAISCVAKDRRQSNGPQTAADEIGSNTSPYIEQVVMLGGLPSHSALGSEAAEPNQFAVINDRVVAVACVRLCQELTPIVWFAVVHREGAGVTPRCSDDGLLRSERADMDSGPLGSHLAPSCGPKGRSPPHSSSAPAIVASGSYLSVRAAFLNGSPTWAREPMTRWVPTTSLRETTLSVSRRRAIGGAGERRGR